VNAPLLTLLTSVRNTCEKLNEQTLTDYATMLDKAGKELTDSIKEVNDLIKKNEL
jgi:hypothetical protein